MENSVSVERHLNGSNTDHLHQQASTVDRRRGTNALTPTGSLNKRRKSSTDSPSLNRNPLRKLSISSGHGVCGELAPRSDSPELPAVHFFNSKMRSHSRPASIGVQNSIFDSLKIRGSATSPVSPVSPKSTVSEGARAVKTMANPTASRNQLDVLHTLRKVHSEPSCKPPAVPLTSGNFQHSKPQPPVYQCLSPPSKAQLKKVKEDAILEDSIIVNTEEVASEMKNFPSKNILPQYNDSSSSDSENHYTQLADCTSRAPPALSGPPITIMSSSISEDEFVTGVYKEPIDRSHSVTYPARSRDVSSEKTVNIHGDISEKPVNTNKPLTIVSLEVKRRSSCGSKGSTSNSSASTVTPTGGLVASIDGKTMSLLPDSSEYASKFCNSGFNIDSFAILKSDLKECKYNNSVRNGINPLPSGIHHKKEFRKSFPAVPHCRQLYCSPPGQRKEAFNLNFVSDDEKDSVSSRPYSDHSSIVFLSPIELKPSKNALIRQLPHHEGKENVLSYVFTSPYSTLERFRSRSSDTINSIPHCPPTPKFPVPEPSTSLTQLLQELTGETDITDMSLFYDKHHTHMLQDALSRNCKPKSPADRIKNKILMQHKDGFENPMKKLARNVRQKSNRQHPINPFQIKRRQLHSIPPRHCKSLDYIPSDKEDNATSSPTSSVCGSPKTRHAYLMPLIFGTQTAVTRADQTSLSSLASSSELSHSDPHINIDSGSTIYESEYDNYPPGMLSDEDFFVPESVSDMEIFDDVNVDNVTVSDNFSLDMPVPRFHKKTTHA